MRKADPSQGFFLCFISNMALHFWWGLIALVLLILHFWLDTPWFLSWLFAAIWGTHSLILTAIAYWANRCSEERDPVRQNKNPYSAKDKDLFPGQKSDASQTDDQADAN